MISSSNGGVAKDIASGKSNLSKIAHSFCSARVRKRTIATFRGAAEFGRYRGMADIE
jgi:hypothetical protein